MTQLGHEYNGICLSVKYWILKVQDGFNNNVVAWWHHFVALVTHDNFDHAEKLAQTATFYFGVGLAGHPRVAHKQTLRWLYDLNASSLFSNHNKADVGSFVIQLCKQ